MKNKILFVFFLITTCILVSYGVSRLTFYQLSMEREAADARVWRTSVPRPYQETDAASFNKTPTVVEELTAVSPVDRQDLSNFPRDFSEVAGRATPAVVAITNYSRGRMEASGGSGVIISEDGYIATNHHVVEDGSSFKVTTADNRDFTAELIGSDPTTDLALLKIRETGLPFLRFGDSDGARVGNWVLAVGNPFELTSTVTAGIVSARSRNLGILGRNSYNIESFIQTDAVVNPGNSGGALVNTEGDLIGINTAILSQGGSFEGYSFAVPSNLAEKVVRDLMEFGRVRRALLGIGIEDVTSTQATDFGLPAVAGVRIRSIQQGSTAEVAGFAVNDVIVSINDADIAGVPDLQEQVGRYRPGEYIDVMYYRDGQLYRKRNVKLMELHANSVQR